MNRTAGLFTGDQPLGLTTWTPTSSSMNLDIPLGESFYYFLDNPQLRHADQISFTESGITQSYNVFTAESPDSSMGSTGDICISPLSGSTAVFIRQQDRWTPADLGITLTTGIAYPNCRHPTLPIMRLRFDATHTPPYYWCHSAYFKTLAGRGRRIGIDREDSMAKATLGE